jgi:hypothetical protein
MKPELLTKGDVAITTHEDVRARAYELYEGTAERGGICTRLRSLRVIIPDSRSALRKPREHLH